MNKLTFSSRWHQSSPRSNIPRFDTALVAASPVPFTAARSTMDVDLLCEMGADKIQPFLTNLAEGYYVSESAIKEAISRKRSFNLIHLLTSFKIDVFISERRKFDLERLARAQPVTLGSHDQQFAVLMSSVEDSIISKLEWYRKGNEASERQWDDVSRLISLLGNNADFDYLHNAARLLGVTDLLELLVKQN